MMMMRAGNLPPMRTGIDLGKIVSEAGVMAWNAASRVVSENPQLAAAGTSAALLTLLTFTLGRSVPKMAPAPEKDSQVLAPSFTSSPADTPGAGPTDLTSSAPLSTLTKTDPEVLAAIATLQALPEGQRKQILELARHATETGLEAAAASMEEQGLKPVASKEPEDSSDDDDPSQASPPSTPTPKTPTKVLNHAQRFLVRTLTPEHQTSRGPLSSSSSTLRPSNLSFHESAGKSAPPPVTPHLDKTTSPPTNTGPSKATIILLTLAGVSFFAYTMAYGLPSFGKIKGWISF